MTITIGKHKLKVKEKPDIIIDGEKCIMSIILVVEDEDRQTYELHYFSTMDDPDLIVRCDTFEMLSNETENEKYAIGQQISIFDILEEN